MPSLIPDPDPNRARRHGIVALLFVGLALFMVYLPGSEQQRVASLLRSTVLRPFIATQEVLARTRVQRVEATELRREMDSLVALLTNQTTLAEENLRLRALLGLHRRLGVDYIPASLLRPGTEGSESMFLLQVGGDPGVREGAPVITTEGLVGVVRDVGSGGAIGMDWTHPDFRASVMTPDGATFGIVEPRRGDFREEDRLVLTGTPFSTRLGAGTRLVTSGRGGIYPRGIPVGTVGELAEAEGGWRKTYWVEPAVELGRVTHVLVGVGETVLPPGPEAVPDTSVAEGELPGREEEAVPPADTVEGSPPDLQSIMLDPRSPSPDTAPGGAAEGSGAPAAEPEARPGVSPQGPS